MDSETDISDAIAQLEMLGIDRNKAIKALNRYNYNVERAADFVFSGNADSDDDNAEISANSTPGPTSTNSNALDWPWAEPSSFDTITIDQTQAQPIQQAASFQSGNITDSVDEEQLPVYMVKDYEEKHKQRTDTTNVTHDPSSWSVVPFTANEDTMAPATTSESNWKTERPFTQSSLTWWTDPEDPAARAAIADVPAGLRPPSYNYAYSPIIIQALFHVPLLRQAVLAYRPTAHAWGAPYNYWKGYGEPVPGYKVKNRQQTCLSTASRISASSSPVPTNQNQNQSTSSSSHNDMPNLMDLTINDTDKLEEPTFYADSSDLDQQQNQSDHQEQEPLELITITQETTDTSLPLVDELEPMTKETLALAELQKLFAFLGNTKRLYGSVAHFMRAINARTVTSSTDWQVDDKSIEDFLDSVIGGMVATENASIIDQNGNWKESNPCSLKNMFFLQAEVENGSDVEIEEIYYLNLGINTAMHSFHDCLDPLVYESFPNEVMLNVSNDGDDDDLGSNTSDDDLNGSMPYKLTTFLQVPPLLLITLEDRHDYQQQRIKKNGSFKVEKTIYLDRYLTENKAMVLDKYRLADQWKQDIRRIRQEMMALQRDGTSPSLPDGIYTNNSSNDGDGPSLDKCQILETTVKYLDSQLNAMEATGENLSYIKSLRTLQQTLYQVRDDIDNKKKELEQLICDRQESLRTLFEDAGLRERPYDLRAVLHTDGLNGTGHYWGYLWVEPNEINLLEDIPAQGSGWHRFCDAKVEKVTEQDVWQESTNPFALLYTDRNMPVISKQQLDDITPPDLMQFVLDDNTTFENEINNAPNYTNNDRNSDNSNISSSGSSSSDGLPQPASRLSLDTDHGSIGYNESRPARYSRDYDNCQDSDDRSNYTYQNESYKKIHDDTNYSSSISLGELESEQRRLSTTAMSVTDIQTDGSKFTDMATKNIDEIRNCSGDDCRVMKRFDTFLAWTGDKQTLICYYQVIESNLLTINNDDNGSNHIIQDEEKNSIHSDKLGTLDINSEQRDISVVELGSRLDSMALNDIRKAVHGDKSLFLLFELYEQYLTMGQTLATALFLFADNNFSGSLEQILKSIQQHDTWRTQLMLNDTYLWKHRNLGGLGFDDILFKYGKACIKKLNIEAYNKACNMAYRSRGLQDGIRIANQAQLMMSKSKDPNESFLSDIGGRWLNFAELQSGSLTEDQVELLNTLVVIYLDGPTTTMSNSTAIISANTTTHQQQGGFSDATRLQDHQTDTSGAMDEPLWIVFKKSILGAEEKLADLV